MNYLHHRKMHYSEKFTEKYVKHPKINQKVSHLFEYVSALHLR